MFLGHRVHLKAKAGGDNSIPEKREPLEDAEGAVPQDPCDRAKAVLPERRFSRTPNLSCSHPIFSAHRPVFHGFDGPRGLRYESL